MQISIPSGAIKRKDVSQHVYLTEEFQFLLVRLKDLKLSAAAKAVFHISIPSGAIKRTSFAFKLS